MRVNNIYFIHIYIKKKLINFNKYIKFLLNKKNNIKKTNYHYLNTLKKNKL